MPSSLNTKRKMIASVQRAIDILNLYDRQRIELGVTEIARAMQLPKGTVAGLVHTLAANGWLEQNPETRKYRLGYKIAEYGSILLNQSDLGTIAMPFLEQLRDSCNESVNLAVRDHAHVVYIERLYGASMLGVRSEIGKREAIHSTALGKAILSRLPEEELRQLLSRSSLIARTPHTIVEVESLIEDLQRSRERGYALDNEENELGGRCVASPIVNYRDKPIAAVSISAPVQRFPEEQIPEFGLRVRKAAEAISQRAGYM